MKRVIHMVLIATRLVVDAKSTIQNSSLEGIVKL